MKCRVPFWVDDKGRAGRICNGDVAQALALGDAHFAPTPRGVRTDVVIFDDGRTFWRYT